MSLKDYIAQVEANANRPTAGDAFAIELEDGTLLETYVLEVQDDVIVLDSTDKILSVLSEWADLDGAASDVLFEHDDNNDEDDSSAIIPALAGGAVGYAAGSGMLDGAGSAIGNALSGLVGEETEQEPSPVARAVLHRILMQHPSIISTHGPEKVLQAIDDLADSVNIGPDDEIGSSDVSGWVREVIRNLSELSQDSLDETHEELVAVEPSADHDAGEYDYEGGMAKDELHTIIRAARRLNGMLDDNENMPEWVQSKITKAADYVDTAADYIESNKEQGVAEGFFGDMLDKINFDSGEANAAASAKDKEFRARWAQLAPKAKAGDPKAQKELESLRKQIHYWKTGEGDVAEGTNVTDYNPKSQGGTRKELLAKYHNTKDPKDAEAARKAGATQKELRGVAEDSLNELSPGLLQRAAQVAKVKRDQALNPEVHNALGGGYMNPLSKHYDAAAEKFSDRATKIKQRDAVKKIASPAVMRKVGIADMAEAEYQGHKVPLGKPMRGDVKKFKVYVRDPKTGNVKKVNFGHGGTSAKRAGQKTMKIKKSNPARRRSFRARHHCENPGPRTKARYWSCRAW